MASGPGRSSLPAGETEKSVKLVVRGLCDAQPQFECGNRATAAIPLLNELGRSRVRFNVYHFRGNPVCSQPGERTT